jgi:hypothetical protein
MIEILPGFTVDGSHVNNEMFQVDICGTEDGRQVAWVKVNNDGTVSFSNQQGAIASCSLDNGLKVGSKCSFTDSEPLQSTTATSARRQSFTLNPITSQFGTSTSVKLGPETSGSSSVAGCSCNPVNA